MLEESTLMGNNRLLAKDIYLEVIAANPAALPQRSGGFQ